MERYLLDTNAYFALLEYISSEQKDSIIEKILAGKCYISKATQIEIISVIGKHSRGGGGEVQVCNRIHQSSTLKCGEKYITPKRKSWSTARVKDWLKLVKEVSDGKNNLLKVDVLDINEKVMKEAELFIQNALRHNFKSMDAIILGTAKANSSEDEQMIVVTADKGLKAGMDRIHYPNVSIK